MRRELVKVLTVILCIASVIGTTPVFGGALRGCCSPRKYQRIVNRASRCNQRCVCQPVYTPICPPTINYPPVTPPIGGGGEPNTVVPFIPGTTDTNKLPIPNGGQKLPNGGQLATVVRLLLIHDGADDEVKSFLASDAAHVAKHFRTTFAPDELIVDEWGMEQGTTAEIFKARIASISSDPQITSQTLVVWYLGHGKTDEDDSGELHHILDLPNDDERGQDLKRDDLRTAMNDSGARLLCLISDSCSGIKLKSKLVVRSERGGALGNVRADKESMIDLFMRSKGFFDVNSSTPPELALICDRGGCLTTPLLALIERYAIDSTGLELDGNQVLSWKELFPALQTAVQGSFISNLDYLELTYPHEENVKNEVLKFRKQGKQTIVYRLEPRS
ncbi:MAG: hypothetical protein JWP89_835 [Schlesneria sp.]|nr:hypothetical protein [Schlesneria sp.]